MKRASRSEREQPKLNMDVVSEVEEQYSLEDIMREFGGWSKQPESTAAPEEAPVIQTQNLERQDLSEEHEEETAERSVVVHIEETASADQELPQEPAQATETPVEDSAPQKKPTSGKFHFIHLEPAAAEPEADAEKDLPEPERAAESPVWTYQKTEQKPEPVMPKLPQKKRTADPIVRLSKEHRKKPRRQPQQTPQPAAEHPTPEAAYKTACQQTKGIMIRQRLLGVLCLLALGLTAWEYFGVQADSFAWLEQSMGEILLGVLLLGVLLAYDVLVSGVYHILRLRPGLDSALLLQAIVFLIHGITVISEGTLPYAATMLLGLFFALWGRLLENRARRNSLKVVSAMEEQAVAAVALPRTWDNHDCVLRAAGERAQYVADFEKTDFAEKIMRIYAGLTVCMSLVLALLTAALKEQNFLRSWAAMLAGALPAAAFITYWKPFYALSRRLLRSGAALCGWKGARQLSRSICVAIEDGDLFAKTNVTMNGMKVFGEYNVSQVVGYTYAVIAASGCGLEPAFHDVFVNQNGRSYVVDHFKRYEGGGIGAEIQGEVILIGSIGFMQLMGVRMPEGTNVRQAVYCAVNQELAAVFAINYNPSSAVRSGLQMLQRNKDITLLLATRDFILTPAMVRHKFKIPSHSMEYPAVEERVRLSSPDAATGGETVALFMRNSFLALAEAVTGGQSLCRSVYASMAVNLLSGVLGFVITAVLAWLGAFAAASAFNFMLYGLLWTLPVMLLTASVGK